MDRREHHSTSLSTGVASVMFADGSAPWNRVGPRICYAPPNDPAGGGDDPPDPPKDDPPKDVLADPAVQEVVKKEVEKATAGLKASRDQLLDEKNKGDKQLKELLEGLGGEEGVKQLTEMRERLQHDKQGELLAAGKHEEWFEQRTAAMKAKFQQEIEQRDKLLAETEAERDAAKQELLDYRLNQRIANDSVDVKVKPAYYVAVNKLVRDRIRLEEGEFVVYEEDGKTQSYGPRGKPMTVAELIDGLRETLPDMFEPSTGGGAGGGKSAANGGANPWIRGPQFNITEQGRIAKANPEMAKRLKAEAGAV